MYDIFFPKIYIRVTQGQNAIRHRFRFCSKGTISDIYLLLYICLFQSSAGEKRSVTKQMQIILSTEKYGSVSKLVLKVMYVESFGLSLHNVVHLCLCWSFRRCIYSFKKSFYLQPLGSPRHIQIHKYNS